MKKGIYLLFTLVLLISSCNKEEYEAPKSKVVDLAGTWYVKLFYFDGSEYRDLYLDAYNVDFWGKIITSNTASNNDSMWVIDTDADYYLWDFQSKVATNTSDLTFSNPNAVSIVEDYEIETAITNGKILKGAATSPGGNITDSIVFDIVFEDFDDPCRIAGYKRTGWPEDEH